jgi:hypothetical protein
MREKTESRAKLFTVVLRLRFNFRLFRPETKRVATQ